MSDPAGELVPEVEPYTSEEGYGRLKEDFKTVIRQLEKRVKADRPQRVLDVGCANGELLYFLHRRFPHWNLVGVDKVEAFIETARDFDGLSEVRFECADFFEFDGEYDVVLSTCVIPGYRDVEPVIDKLLSLCRDGGHVLATGLFNPHDIEVRVEFCDNSRPETAGRWRTDFNRHSRQSIRRMFGDRVEQLEFERCPFDAEIDHDPDHPIRVWTVEDREGNYHLRNGAGQLLNQTLMVLTKPSQTRR